MFSRGKKPELKMLAILLFLHSFSFSASAAPLMEIAQKCACVPGAADPYESPVRYAFGAYAGQCVDSCHFRNLRLLEENRGTIRIANFLHKHRYWKAAFRPRELEAVEVLFEDFLRGVAHVSLRFRFRRGMQLDAQGGGPGRAQTRDLIFSPEGTPPKGSGIDLVRATLGNYILTYRALSIEEMAEWTGRVKKNTVRSFPLRLSPVEQERLLRLVLEKGAERDPSPVYALLNNNCATTTVDLLAQTSGRSAPPWEWVTRAFSVDADVGTLHWLGSAGLVDPGAGRLLPNGAM